MKPTIDLASRACAASILYVLLFFPGSFVFRFGKATALGRGGAGHGVICGHDATPRSRIAAL